MLLSKEDKINVQVNISIKNCIYKIILMKLLKENHKLITAGISEKNDTTVYDVIKINRRHKTEKATVILWWLIITSCWLFAIICLYV